ncbi:MAG: FAD-binding oxidoreductase, partial [Pseudolabrys sp.]
MNAVTKPKLALWSDAEELECVSFLPEAPNVMTFCFQSPSGALFSYDPGQFITLELPIAGGPIYRTFTISSSPSRPTSLTVTVKAQEKSIGSQWMFDNLRPGMRVRARGPAGEFSIAHHPAEKYLFISAGSGITPMMSMITHYFDSGRIPDIVFVNCARKPSDIIFRGRLEH